MKEYKLVNEIIKEASFFTSFGRKAKDFGQSSMNKIKFHNEASKAEGGASGLSLPKMVGVLVAAIGVNQFVKQMMEYAKIKNIEMKKPQYYEQMIRKNPELLEEDPEEVMDLWNTLYHHSYHMAQDPVSAGAFIRQSVAGKVRQDLGGPTIDTYSTLNAIDSDAAETKQRRLDTGINLTDRLITGLGIGSV